MGESTIPPCFTDFRSPYQPPQLNISTVFWGFLLWRFLSFWYSIEQLFSGKMALPQKGVWKMYCCVLYDIAFSGILISCASSLRGSDQVVPTTLKYTTHHDQRKNPIFFLYCKHTHWGPILWSSGWNSESSLECQYFIASSFFTAKKSLQQNREERMEKIQRSQLVAVSLDWSVLSSWNFSIVASLRHSLFDIIFSRATFHSLTKQNTAIAIWQNIYCPLKIPKPGCCIFKHFFMRYSKSLTSIFFCSAAEDGFAFLG